MMKGKFYSSLAGLGESGRTPFQEKQIESYVMTGTYPTYEYKGLMKIVSPYLGHECHIFYAVYNSDQMLSLTEDLKKFKVKGVNPRRMYNKLRKNGCVVVYLGFLGREMHVYSGAHFLVPYKKALKDFKSGREAV